MRNSETLINEMQLSALPFCKKTFYWAKSIQLGPFGVGKLEGWVVPEKKGVK